MSIFDSVIADDARFGFLDDDGFGAETVTYTKASGATRSIKAQIERAPPTEYGGETPRPYVVAVVMNDSTYGIAASEIDYGGDTITVTSRLGKSSTSRAHKIHRPADGAPDHDAAMIRIELR